MPVFAQELPPPVITNLTVNGNFKTLQWEFYPAAESYQVLGQINVAGTYQPDLTGTINGNTWTGQNALRSRYWRLLVNPMSSNALASANVLNRIAYGPTPDDLDALATSGPQAYIDSQLQPELQPAPNDATVYVRTNGVPGIDPATNWVSISVTGTVSSSTLYMYMRAAADVYIDDIQLRLIVVDTVAGTTNLGPNVLVNGDFESPLTTGWTVGQFHTGSSLSTTIKRSGTASLHIVATQAGSTRASSIYQDIVPALPAPEDGVRAVLSFSYLPSPKAPLLTLRLSGNGIIISGADVPESPRWIYITETGQATATPRIYLYLSDVSEGWIDSVKLVAGTVPEAGANLLQNPGFESGGITPWIPSGNHSGSFVDSTVSYEGGSSLRLVAAGPGSGSGTANAVIQNNIAGLASGQTYTLSYWYRPATFGRTLTARLSGSLLNSTPDADGLPAQRRRLDDRTAEIEDLRAWHIQNAVGSKRQLLEILLQFLENHFVTEHAKSHDFFDGPYDGVYLDRYATDWEYRENKKWREALLRPDCTFYDLLEISAESPAMIVYLDTVDSKGNDANIANENYARELLELFCNGVDNGYDQNDIVAMSRAWTGWSVDILDHANIDNPLGARSTTYGFFPGNGFNATSNLVGVWTFKYNSANHGTNRAPIFSIWDPASPGDNPRATGPKTVPPRFGSPWAGTSYQLVIPRRTGNASIQDAYDVIRHMANLPFTMEYISVKLCRLFVHDNFVHGVYNYTDPGRSPEADLVHQCMVAWNGTNPKGQIRNVLRVIFNSTLFRSHGGSMQKVKTPIEFAVSAIRALRSDNGSGTFTASTDGYDIGGTSRTGASPLSRMGSMFLFDRGEPDGYPEAGPPWISAGTLAERLRFVQSFLIAPGGDGKSDGGNDNVCDPVALLKRKTPSSAWDNPGLVAEYFLRTLFPGEGLGNLNQYRSLAVEFLTTEDDGVTPSNFGALGNSTPAYDTRVRGMVALLMSLPRFQEQ